MSISNIISKQLFKKYRSKGKTTEITEHMCLQFAQQAIVQNIPNRVNKQANKDSVIAKTRLLICF